MTTDKDQSILEGLLQPNIESTVQRMYGLYFDNIIAQIVANGGTHDDGSDVFQDAIVALIEKVKSGQFRGDSSIKTYLSSIARNLWLFELRTRGRRKKREQLYFTDNTDEQFEEIGFSAKKNGSDLMETMSQIGDTCKKILTGFYYEDKSMKEILNTVEFENEQVLRNKKSKCMKKLKELLQSNISLLNSLNKNIFYEH